jgi:endoglucanase
VLDDNSASDADVWLAYTLSEAGRLWREPRYTQLAQALSATILREEVAMVAGLGPTLLPGMRGFVSEQTWRFNASYLPLQALRLLAREHNPLWRDIAASALRIILASAPQGYAMDWIEYRSADKQGFITDRTTHGLGSYDAIRVYLWAGMLAPTDPDFNTLQQQLAPALQLFAQHPYPAERIDTGTNAFQGIGSPGFSAAYLPLLKTNRQLTTLAQQLERTQQSLANNQAYYSDVLTLFGRGWLDDWIRFAANGRLQVKWSGACAR